MVTSGNIGGGIIPAHAGNTRPVAPVAGHMEDHPRACGEHAPFEIAERSILGSSPRMRGTLAHYDDPFHMGGIIPAHAGNT